MTELDDDGDHASRGSLAPDDDASVDAEVDALLVALAAAPARRRALARLEPGTCIGDHLRIERLLGSGGMGVVYLARDLRLDRDVAVKLLGSRSAPAAIERLDREARAMAQLSHPNVAVIHEVGSHEGHLYLAIEYVDGGTARSWLAEQRRSWRAMVALYVQAGRGLVAAHAAQLVHRDFKPDNVLVGRDGRVRVADFGLVRALVSSDGEPERARASIGSHDRGAASSLTGADAVLGTPAYMAPEQLAGREAGPAADQYAFCVALFEALHGRRPAARGPRPDVGARGRSAGPRWLQRAIDRGLAEDPQQRWPSLAALVERLERGIAPVSGRRVAAVVGSLAVGAVAVVALLAPKLATATCNDAHDRIAEIWSSPRREALALHFVERSGDAGSEQWRATETLTQRWVDAWVAARASSCAATRVDGTQTEYLLERSMICLEQRAGALDALLTALAEAPDPAAVAPARALEGIASPAGCHDVQYLLAQVEPPRDSVAAAAVDAARAELARLHALLLIKRLDLVQAAMPPLRAVAEASGYAPILAEVLMASGLLAQQDGRAAEAEELFIQAHLTSRRSNHHDIAVDSALALASIEIDRSGFRPARTWIELARVEVARGEAIPEAETSLEQRDAQLLEAQGHPERAIDHYRRALALAIVQRGEGPAAAWMREDIATALDAAGRPADAALAHREAIDALERAPGANLQLISFAYSNYGLSLGELGRFDASIAAHRSALELHDELNGPDSLASFGLHLNLGIALAGSGRLDEARSELDHALALANAREIEDDIALTLGALAYVASRDGDHARALTLVRRALAIHRRMLGPDHPTVAASVTQSGDALLELGRVEEARAAFLEATEIWARGGNDRSATAAAAWVGLAQAELAIDDLADAGIHAGRVLESPELADVEPEVRAQAQYIVARVLVDTDGDEARAHELADAAADTLRGSGRADEADEISSWLAAHPRG